LKLNVEVNILKHSATSYYYRNAAGAIAVASVSTLIKISPQFAVVILGLIRIISLHLIRVLLFLNERVNVIYKFIRAIYDVARTVLFNKSLICL